MKYANVEFVPVERAGDAIIRIMPSSNRNSSVIGRHALTIPTDSPTMWLQKNVKPETVLHEFGHAIGFVHEHQNPRSRISWDHDAVYEYFGAPPNNWSRATIDRTLLQKSEVYPCIRDFDPKSIMMYQIPSRFTTDGTEYSTSTTLSESDKLCVSEMYPFPSER